jgi:DHA2 family multidrug resistance protein-like MFS transporter
VLSVARPTLSTALHASESSLQWFSSGYALVLAAAMLPAGVIGDRYGRKRALTFALVLFGAGSVACAYAPSVAAFLAARVVLGIAGAGIIVMAVSALVVLFSEEERPRAVAIWAGVNFISFPIGPIFGGWLLSHYWWGWVFLINAPIALVGLIAVLALVPESRAPDRPSLDPVGILASAAGLVGITFGLIEAGRRGWLDALSLVLMIAGLAVLVLFFMWEDRLGRRPGGLPLADMALFRSRFFSWGIVLMALGSLALVGVLFTLPQYFQGVRGLDAFGSGVRLLPLVGGFLAGLAPSSLLSRALGAKLTVALGFIVLAVGFSLGAGTAIGTGDGFTALWTAVSGAGMGLLFATAASAAISEVSAERSGVGSAMMQAFKNIGAPFGSAILGSVLSSLYLSHLQLGNLPAAPAAAAKQSVFGGVTVANQVGSNTLLHSVLSAFVRGMDGALWASAGIAVFAALLAIIFLPGRRAPAAAAKGEPAVEAD